MKNKPSSKDDGQDAFALISAFREKWPRHKFGLLFSHMFYAIDETNELGGESEDMKELEDMLYDLFDELNKLVPERREKPNLKRIERELLKEDITEDEEI